MEMKNSTQPSKSDMQRRQQLSNTPIYACTMAECKLIHITKWLATFLINTKLPQKYYAVSYNLPLSLRFFLLSYLRNCGHSDTRATQLANKGPENKWQIDRKIEKHSVQVDTSPHTVRFNFISIFAPTLMRASPTKRPPQFPFQLLLFRRCSRISVSFCSYHFILLCLMKNDEQT